MGWQEGMAEGKYWIAVCVLHMKEKVGDVGGCWKMSCSCACCRLVW